MIIQDFTVHLTKKSHIRQRHLPHSSYKSSKIESAAHCRKKSLTALL